MFEDNEKEWSRRRAGRKSSTVTIREKIVPITLEISLIKRKKGRQGGFIYF